MAKKNRSNGLKASDVAIPEGFDINVGREKSLGWIKKEVGNLVQGRILGRFTFRGDDQRMRAYYQIQLEKPSKVIWADPEKEDDEDYEGEEVTRNAGDVVNLDESAALNDLAKAVATGGTYDVWFVYKAKEASRSGPGGFWAVHGPRLRQVKAPVANASPF